MHLSKLKAIFHTATIHDFATFRIWIHSRKHCFTSTGSSNTLNNSECSAEIELYFSVIKTPHLHNIRSVASISSKNWVTTTHFLHSTSHVMIQGAISTLHTSDTHYTSKPCITWTQKTSSMTMLGNSVKWQPGDETVCSTDTFNGWHFHLPISYFHWKQ